MRVACLAALLLAAGCTLNVPELTAAQATLDLRLAQRKEIADNLYEMRRATDTEDERLAEALKDLSPEQRAVIDAVKAGAEPPQMAEPKVSIPLESRLEGNRATLLRMRLADTERRIAELDKVLKEIGNVTRHRKDVAAKLAAIEKLKADRAKP